MKAVIQRVTQANVSIDGTIKGKISSGLLVFLGIVSEDTLEDIQWLSNKIVQLRVFNDDEGVMNLSLKDIKGEILVISQFTLHAKTKKDNRPSYIKAARPEHAVPIYEQFLNQLKDDLEQDIQEMKIKLHMKEREINITSIMIHLIQHI